MVGSPESPRGERSGGDHQGAKARNQHRFHRCRAGQRHPLGRRASRPGGPRPDVLRRRQADDRLRLRFQRGESGGASAGWQDRRGRRHVSATSTSPSPATTPTARSTRASPATAGRRPTSGLGANAVALQADGKIVVVGSIGSTATSPSPATTRTARSTRASPATASRRLTSGRQRRGDRSGDPGRRQDRRRRTPRTPPAAATSRSPATTPTARSTRASPATASRRPTSGAPRRSDRGGAPGRRQDRRGRRPASSGQHRLRPRPLQPERLARHELLRRRQADDRLRRRRRGERGGDPGRRQDRRGRRHESSAPAATSPSPATTPTARSTRASPATASRPPTRRHFDEATGVAIQSDGKIVASARRRRHDFALARYNPNGTLDTSFSGDGKQTTDFSGSLRTAVALQANGKIVAVGGSESSGSASDDFALARYNPNGSLDTTFSGDGKQTTDFGGEDEANGVAIQEDGKIVVVGPQAGTGIDFALARYNPNGTLDTSFSGDGKQTTDFGGVGQVANAVAVQDDGKIVVVGDAGPMFSDDFALARYNPNGSLDTSFSGDGKQTTNFVATDEATAWRFRATARSSSVGTGVDNVNGGSEGALARYNPNGTLDTSFSGDGKQTTDFGGSTERRTRWRSRPTARSSRSAPRAPTATARTSRSPATTPTARSTRASPATASRRPTFGGSDEAAGVALQGDGKIVAVGEAEPAPAATTSRSPATTPTARSTRASPATASRRPTSGSGPTTRRTAWRSRATARSSRLATPAAGPRARLRPRPLQPRRLARHELLRRRQTEDQLWGRRRGERGGAPGGRQDRRGRARPRFRRNQRFRARPLRGWLSQGRISARGGRLAMQKVVGSNPISRFVRATPPPTPRTRFTPRSWALIVCGRRW